MAQIDQFLKVLVDKGGSDLHLTVGARARGAHVFGE